MKFFTLIVVSILFSFIDTSAQVVGLGGPGWYAFKDYQYFKPPIADIRRPHTHLRFYRDKDLVKADEEKPYWDAGFGGFYPVFGFRGALSQGDSPLQITGFDFFVEPSAHFLFDFVPDELSTIISSDFRLGYGVSQRFPEPVNNFSFRIKYVRESSILGGARTNQNTVSSSIIPEYRVSYEFYDFFFAYDGFLNDDLYLRTYSGYRWFTEDTFPDFNSSNDIVLKGGKNEAQFGVELVVYPATRNFLDEFFLPRISNYIMAVDIHSRHEFDPVSPKRVVGINWVWGISFGDYLGAYLGDNPIALLINYYSGPNPHGQLKQDLISYFGVDLSFGF